MFPFFSRQLAKVSLCLSLCLIAAAPILAEAATGFQSFDNRLPNPDRPYDMTSGTVNFRSPPFFGLYDLQFQPLKPSQLDVPTRNAAGQWEFDSSFDIIYHAMVSISTQPVHFVSGIGTAHIVGVSPGDLFHQEFDAEILSLNLQGIERGSDIRLRESPSLRSVGLTVRDDVCPPCAWALTRWQISSYFDVFAEVSFDGGATWTPGDQAIHIEQPANPLKMADFNEDGTVDARDYVQWRSHNGSIYTSADYDLWRMQFNQASSSSNVSGVPEPSACLLLTWLAFLIRRPNR
jgi:hypothetical protein